MRHAVVGAALLPVLTWGQSRDFRFYLAYGDEQLVAIARSSGTDAQAVIGKEIPQSLALRVPSLTSFRVQVHTEHLDNGYGAVYTKNLTSYVAYDRARLFHLASTSGPALDENSFRKVAPIVTANMRLNENASNFQSRIVYDNNRNTLDENGDGVPDLATFMTLGSGHSAGGWLSVNNNDYVVRPAGLSHYVPPVFRTANGNFGIGWIKMLPGERMHMFDLEYTNALAVGETYGYGSGETGLLLHTTGGEQDGNANNMGFNRNSIFNREPWRNIGAKYNLIGAAPAPEPGSVAVLALGILTLVRRRRA